MNASNIQRVVIVGAGASGQQIGAQFARFGYEVMIHDVDEGRLDECVQRQRRMLADLVSQSMLGRAEVDETLSRISCSADPAVAAAEADLLCECVPENVELKRGVLRQFNALCKPATIFTTNTSYLLPSSLAISSGRPERFAAFHFHVPVWYANAVDVMPHRRTLPDVVTTLCDLAVKIGQVPILARREHPGYVFNTLLQPLLLSAINLVARDVADFQDVDRAWMAVTKMPAGPFGILDQIGLDTVQQIVQHSGRWLSEAQKRRAADLLEPYLLQDRRGEKSGHGFYQYPDPAYRSAQFLPAGAPQSGGSGRFGKQRLTPELTPAVIPPQVRHRLEFSGRVIVWSCEGLAAETISLHLQRAGATVCRVPEDLSTDQLVTWLEGQWQMGPAPHLCLISRGIGREQRAPGTAGPPLTRRLEHPFLLTQSWFRHVHRHRLLDTATLLAVCRAGQCAESRGNEATRPMDLAVASLVKSVALESLAHAEIGIRARVVGIPPELTEQQCAEISLKELALAQAAVVTGGRAESRRRHADIDVSYCDGRRHVVRYRRAACTGAGDAPPPRGVWLVSGGSGGITLRAALALARHYSLQLHLLGRTPVPDQDYTGWPPERLQSLKAEVMKTAYRRGQKPNVAWQPYEKGIRLQQSLALLEREEIPATYHVCDVSDQTAVARVVASICRQGLQIAGILHGAGIEHTSRFESKTIASLHQTVAPKLDGARALFEATRQQPLEWFVAFGSLAGRFGGIGQVDYVMANALMAQAVSQFGLMRPSCRCVTIHWPGWQDVGMAARPESRFLLERAQHHLMPLAEGIEHLLREIDSGGSDTEVVIADPEELGPEFLCGGSDRPVATAGEVETSRQRTTERKESRGVTGATLS